MSVRRRRAFHVPPQDAGRDYDSKSNAFHERPPILPKILDAAEFWLWWNDPLYNVPTLDDEGNEIKPLGSDAWHGSRPSGITEKARKVRLLEALAGADEEAEQDLLRVEGGVEDEERDYVAEVRAVHARLEQLAAKGKLPLPEDMTEFERNFAEEYRRVTFEAYDLRECADQDCRVRLWVASDALKGPLAGYCNTPECNKRRARRRKAASRRRVNVTG